MPLLLLLLAGLLLPASLFAQETLSVKAYGVDQGLPQSTVWDILQDDYGFLWVSTADGLCRFDGYTFNTYRNNPEDSLSIGGNTTHQLALDSGGNIWLTHDQGFDKYNAIRGNFTSLYRYTALRSSVFNKTIGEDTKGFVWVWISGEGLMKFDRRTNKRAGKFLMEGKHAWRNEQFSRDALLDTRDNIWMIQRSNSIISFNTTTNKFNVIDMELELGALCSVNDSVLIIGTKKGLLRYNTSNNTFETLVFHTTPEKKNELYQTTCIIAVKADEFWIGTTKGIFVYNDKERKFTSHYTSTSGGKENFLFVQALFVDRSHNIWIGTNGDGLKKHSPKSVPWKHYQSAGAGGDIVKSIYADGNDLVFVGYYENGLDVYGKSKGHLWKINKGKAPWFFPSDMVYAISGIDASRIFISFSSPINAFCIYDYRNQLLQNVTSGVSKLVGTEGLIGNTFPVILPAGDGSLLFTSRNAIFQARFPVDKNPEYALVKQFPAEVINSVYRDRSDNLWVGTLNGYYVKKQQSDDWTKGKALSKQIKTICEDTEGKIWMGTTSGLYVLSKNGNIEKTWKVGDPLVSDFIYGILRDDQGDMWFSHNKGLTRYNHLKKTFRNFSVDDGLQSNEFNTGAYYKSVSGELFFGGIHGVNSFFPEDIKDNPQIPAVQITRIEVHDKPLASATVNWAQQNITLDYSENTLSFEFAGLEFTEPNKNQYAWRMSGIDRDWVYSGNKRFTRYANIAPGEYSFEVKASNSDGVWNETPTALSIVIIPPYWQTWWFRILELTAGAAVVALIAYAVSRQRYRRKLQAMEVRQKIQHDRERISRELHDNIGAQLSLISSNLDWVTDAGAVLTDNERKTRISNINELSKEITGNLRETIWALNKETISFQDFTDRLKRLAQKLVSVRPEVKLIFVDEGTGLLDLKPEEALNLLRICQETIHNAVKHSGMSVLRVSWKADADEYKISVEDNGKGFIKQANLNDHYGLENVQKRAGEIGATAVVSTSERGTTVMVSK